jgi:hypothetical protein
LLFGVVPCCTPFHLVVTAFGSFVSISVSFVLRFQGWTLAVPDDVSVVAWMLSETGSLSGSK